ncbi:TPA: hypothetical protein ACPVYT_004556 [Vibrio parahaemolyticus]
MAYDLHIEETGKSVEQWREFVVSYPSLTISDKAEAKNPKTGSIIFISTPNTARSDNGLYFTARDESGQLTITIRKPRTEDIPYLKEIAKNFGGTLIGDEGEKY